MLAIGTITGRGRLLDLSALPLADDVKFRLAQVATEPGRAWLFRGHLADIRSRDVDTLTQVADLTLELPGGTRVPVTLGRVDDVGHVPVLGCGTLPEPGARAAS